MLAIVSTHPIQYQTPIWSALASDGRVPFEVWYLSDFGVRPTLDRAFGKVFRWDIDTLSGYPHRFLEGASDASPESFWQCRLRERLREKLRALDVKAVWIQGWQVAGYWQVVQEARAAGIEVWLRGESNDLAPTAWWKRTIKQAVLAYLFSRIRRFLYIGSGNRRLYRKFGVAETKLLPAPYAVDNERFAKQARELLPQRNEIRRQWNIADDAVCVLFCGKFIGKKRPLDIVEAARLLNAKRAVKMHLLFVGSGELGDDLRAACNVVFDAEGQAKAVDENLPRATFAGFLNQTEVSRAYVAAECLVLPSDHGETWGLVVNEAMASGLPCIVSDACGCAEDLAGAEWSFPLGDTAALAQKIAALHAAGITAPARMPASFAETVAAVNQAYAVTISGR